MSWITASIILTFRFRNGRKTGTIIFLQNLGLLRSMSDFTKFYTHKIVHCKGEKDPAEFSVKLDRQKEMGSAVKRQKFQFSIEIFPVFR